MIYKISKNDIEKIVLAEHNNPHRVLGMHRIYIKNKKRLIVRVYIPSASNISIIDIKNQSRKFKMIESEYKGFFECIIPRRRKKFHYMLECESIDGNRWTMLDSYSFKPKLSNLDHHLFCEGTDYNIHKKLGAHIERVGSIWGVRFALWAPNAMRVSVIGDFNHWDGRRHSMTLHKDSGIWEIFIPGIAEKEKYKFEIKSPKNNILVKSDPYGMQHELRPNTASIVYRNDRYRWGDATWIDRRKNAKHYNQPISIYEIHIGSWKRRKNGKFMNYREIAHELTRYILQMKYTHVELIGIMEHPYDGSWGYQVTGYFAPTSRYGSPDDFKYLVDTLHKNNIGVILDWVPAHFPKDPHGLECFDETTLYEYNDKRKAEHPQWGTLVFDYGKKEVQLFLIASAISWFERFHIDGIRVDAVASMIYLDYGKEGTTNWVPNIFGGRENLEAVDFIKHLNTVLYSKFEGIITIAEESTSWPGVTKPVSLGGLGFGFKWNMGWMNDFLEYMKLDPIYRKYHHEKITFSFMYAFSENFIQVLSHDEVVHEKCSMINKMPGNKDQKFANLRVAYGYMYTHPGKKMLFMGGEFAQYNEWCEAKGLDWHLLSNKEHRQIKKYIGDLNRLYLKESALWEYDNNYKGFKWIDCNNKNDSVIAFYRKSSSSNLIVICNFTPQVHYSYRVGVEQKGEYIEIFNSDNKKYGGSGIINEKISYENKSWHGYDNSIVVKIPPLSLIIIKV